MQYFLYILAIPFLWINYKIIASDIKYKIIPNIFLKYLLLLIPFYYIYIFVNYPEINYIFFFGQIILTFIISFILFYFNIWAAGDAKYLLVLSLFIPYIGIVPFIGNIALITIIYLLLYFLYFYLGKVLFNKTYRQNITLNIKQDLKESWKNYKGNKGGRTYKVILKFLLIFFVIFVSIRLSRIYLFNSILENGNSVNILSDIIHKYNIYIIFLVIGIFIGGLYIFRTLINKIKIYISEKYKINLELVGNILLAILSILLISFITNELINNHKEISQLLFRIFTLYLAIYLIIKILIYSYKITFGISEYYYIKIKNLKKGDIVDKTYLVQMFGKQKILGNYIEGNTNYNENGIFFPSPKKYFTNIKNPIDKKTINMLNKTYNIVNKYQKEKNENYTKIESIKILNTFSFGPYIFLGFIFTYLFQNDIFKYILNTLINIFKSFY